MIGFLQFTHLLNRYKQKLPQQQPREDLAQIIATHFASKWQRPIAAHSLAAFESIRGRIESSSQSLVIDSCCGTGDSTRNLAAALPDSLVLGIDKSSHRLARHRDIVEQNYLMLRADVNDFWRLALEARWQPTQHYLFYPNPYPKASQIRKRWYGSPAFPTLLGLGGQLTVRSNWSIYIQEFVLALNAVGFDSHSRQVTGEEPVSAFEAKYQERGDTLFELVCDFDQTKPC